MVVTEAQHCIQEQSGEQNAPEVMYFFLEPLLVPQGIVHNASFLWPCSNSRWSINTVCCLIINVLSENTSKIMMTIHIKQRHGCSLWSSMHWSQCAKLVCHCRAVGHPASQHTCEWGIVRRHQEAIGICQLCYNVREKPSYVWSSLNQTPLCNV